MKNESIVMDQNYKKSVETISTLDKDLKRYHIYKLTLKVKEKYLATNAVYLSYKHSPRDIKKYLISFEKTFKEISIILKNKNLLKKIKSRKYNY